MLTSFWLASSMVIYTDNSNLVTFVIVILTSWSWVLTKSVTIHLTKDWYNHFDKLKFWQVCDNSFDNLDKPLTNFWQTNLSVLASSSIVKLDFDKLSDNSDNLPILALSKWETEVTNGTDKFVISVTSFWQISEN